MGATYISRSIPLDNLQDAVYELCADLTAGDSEWHDPFDKRYALKAWEEPVPACAVDWVRGYIEHYPPERLADLLDGARHAWDRHGKYGPWLAFPLEEGGWHIFGWVNT